MDNKERRHACRVEKRNQLNGKTDRKFAKELFVAGHISREEYDAEIAIADKKAARYNCESSIRSELVHRALANYHGIEREPQPARFFNAVSGEIETVSNKIIDIITK